MFAFYSFKTIPYIKFHAHIIFLPCRRCKLMQLVSSLKMKSTIRFPIVVTNVDLSFFARELVRDSKEPTLLLQYPTPSYSLLQWSMFCHDGILKKNEDETEQISGIKIQSVNKIICIYIYKKKSFFHKWMKRLSSCAIPK